MNARLARRWTALFALGILAMPAMPAMAADERPFTEGKVVEVTSVLTKPGKFEEYMAYLAGPYRQQQEELKKAGVVLDYGFYAATPRQPGDPDLYLTVTYANMAALDNLDEKSEPSMKKIFGTRQQAAQGTADRESLRTILGSELIRQLTLK